MASLGSTRMMPGSNPISQDWSRQKDENGNTLVAPKGATPVFPDFYTFLVSPSFPSSVFLAFWPSSIRRGPKVQVIPGSALYTA